MTGFPIYGQNSILIGPTSRVHVNKNAHFPGRTTGKCAFLFICTRDLPDFNTGGLHLFTCTRDEGTNQICVFLLRELNERDESYKAERRKIHHFAL